jgi:acyl-CoA thioesterase
MSETENRRLFSPFAELIGMRFTELSSGESCCELDTTESLFNTNGILHGGVAYSMADTGMGAALFAGLEKGQSCATIEIKIVYLRPVTSGRLVCRTKLIQQGRRIAVLESEVKNDDRLVAKALGTFAIIEKRTGE